MKKLNFLKTMLLLCALIVGSMNSVWANSITFDFEDDTAHRTSGSNAYNTNSYTQNGVTISLTYADAVTTGSPLTGTANVTARVAKNTKNSPVITIGAINLAGKRITSIAYNIKGFSDLTVKSEYSTDNSTWTELESYSSPTDKTAKGASNLTITGSATYYFRITGSVSSTKTSNRDFQVDDIVITYEDLVVPVTSIAINKSTLTLAVDETESLSLTEVLPDNATNKTVTWSSSNEAIASVDSSTGEVTAKAVGGPVTITATANDGSGVTATCTVTVIAARVNVDGISLNKTSTTLLIGGNETLTATISPADATNKNVVWTSSDDAVASVDENGVVTANAVGTATITATSEENETIKETCTVTVKPVVVTGVSLNKTTTSIVFGSTETLTATVAPANATNQNVTWSSSNEFVATVSEGIVTPVSVGTTTITVTTEDQGLTATCEVSVTANNEKTLTKETIFEETFASVSGTNAVDVSKFDNTGWIKSGDVYGGGGNGIRMAKGDGAGSVTTPVLTDMVTGATLTILVHGWDGDETQISLSGTNCTLSETSFTDLPHGSEFVERSASVTVTGENPTITLTAASGKRVYVKSVTITQPKNSVDVTLNAYGFASYCSPFALDLTPTADYAAYAVKPIGENKVKFTKIAGKVAASTPFILYNADKASETVSLPIIEDGDEAIAAVSDNALIGTLSPTYVSAPDDYTNFGLKDSKFVPMSAGVVKKNKAYLQVNNDDIKTDAGARGLEIVFDEGEATGIKAIDNGQLTMDNVYDLSGRKIVNGKSVNGKLQRGLYIVNGKKVVVR